MSQSLGALERRRQRRAKVIAPLSIVFDEGRCTIDCVAYDWTDKGAKLRPTDVVSCPDRFTLVKRSGESWPCRVIWRRNDYLGVEFETAQG